MVAQTETLHHRLLRRRCLACGYDGALLRAGQASACAKCGCDLRARPARSYAEMEGLVTEPRANDAPQSHRRTEAQLIHRWLAFMFLAMMGFVAIVYLSAATFSF